MPILPPVLEALMERIGFEPGNLYRNAACPSGGLRCTGAEEWTAWWFRECENILEGALAMTGLTITQ